MSTGTQTIFACLGEFCCSQRVETLATLDRTEGIDASSADILRAG